MNVCPGIEQFLLDLKLSNTVVLANVSLCAIVRDEMINAAYGVEDFIRSTVPFVEAAVIIDTGSVDGTWEKLRELRKEYSNLRIYRKKFNNYSGMRNYSLTKVKTGYVLLLDADERLTHDDFAKLKKQLKQNSDAFYFYFNFKNIYPSSDFTGDGHSIRLFKMIPGIHFKDTGTNAWEFLYSQDGQRADFLDYHNTSIKIKHFKSGGSCSCIKRSHWYSEVVQRGLMSKIAPSKTNDFMEWKKPNPRRVEFV